MTTISRRALRLSVYAAALGSIFAVAACSLPGGGGEGIGFREARFNEISAIRDWQSCRDEAVNLDRQAREEGSAARYLASARLLEKCESDVGSGAKVTADE